MKNKINKKVKKIFKEMEFVMVLCFVTMAGVLSGIGGYYLTLSSNPAVGNIGAVVMASLLAAAISVGFILARLDNSPLG